jgi:glycosyltransferase involved in cell wall biosynthesis
MKVLHVSTEDRGGAGIACIRSHQSLMKRNIDSKVLLFKKTNYTVPGTYKFAPAIPPMTKRVRNAGKRILTRLNLYHELNEEKYLDNQPKGFERFSFPNSKFDITESPLYKECDIVNLHWVTDFLDYSSFFEKNKKKIVWTLHDMNPFTGGCHHSDNCIKYQADCMACPQLQGTLDPNYSHKMLGRKLDALSGYAGNDLSVVTPSAWLKNLSERSTLFSKFPHYHIPHGLDPSIFKIYDKHSARTFFNLPSDKKVILFISNFVQHPRKGLKWLLELVNELENKDEFILCSMGWSLSQKTEFPFHYQLGNIEDERILSLAYSVADIFVLPSFAENSPLTIIESLFCGVPVISFPVGGIPEIINNGENGLVGKDVSIASLKNSFKEFFGGFHPNPQQIRSNAIEKYNEALHASRYEALYQKLLN